MGFNIETNTKALLLKQQKTLEKGGYGSCGQRSIIYWEYCTHVFHIIHLELA